MFLGRLNQALLFFCGPINGSSAEKDSRNAAKIYESALVFAWIAPRLASHPLPLAKILCELLEQRVCRPVVAHFPLHEFGPSASRYLGANGLGHIDGILASVDLGRSSSILEKARPPKKISRILGTPIRIPARFRAPIAIDIREDHCLRMHHFTRLSSELLMISIQRSP